MALFKVFNKKKGKTPKKASKKTVKKVKSKPKTTKKKVIREIAKLKTKKMKIAKKKISIKKTVEKNTPKAKIKPLINKMSDEKAYSLLKRYRIKVPDYAFCKDEKELEDAIKSIGFPMAMKVSGSNIIHKTEIDGIRLDIETGEDAKKSFQELIKIKDTEKVLVQKMIREGYEIIVGGRKDPQFNKVIALGAGGIFTEFLKDVSFRVSPITKEDAESMVMEVRFSDLLLGGFRGQKPANKDAIVNTILTVSRILEANPKIKELDINPLFATHEDTFAADVRIILE
ncbi:MAG: acetate--CoA ligase family protein [Nanoarchaeota archaeon]